jgi:adenosylcobinamide-GDP ribazoletransferase
MLQNTKKQNPVRREIQLLFGAVMFYTRIPCPAWVNHSKENLSQSIKYLPLIGWIIGGLSALVFLGTHLVLPKSIAIIFAMLSGIVATGAFHEDGLADMCDGFGGGWTKEKILEIMKDSRIGAFGMLGLVSVLLLKFFALFETEAATLPIVLIVGHSLSRLIAVTFVYAHNYARDEKSSKVSKAVKRISFSEILIAVLFGVSSLLLFGHVYYFLILLPVFLVKVFLGHYFTKWIGGYTGDCLGAVQQITEITIYLAYLILWKFI